ncbi:MAG: ABC-2 family transporter protein [Deltaproteobacteria bacterium]|nr:ABC-2 family transporter protein [Deltaproteobacteria bacterium]MDQ3298896.1 ABC-2 family transporter protein [Myxococcota bacterium]
MSSRTLRAIPTLLRIGVAETVAYRAEFLVWILTTTLPLVMLALWTSVAAEAPFRNYTSADFVAYFLAGLIVRNLTGSWVAWQISEEIRTGTMSMRLLRPLHPFIAFTMSHLAAVPFRTIVALPIAVVLLFSSGASALATEPVQMLLVVPSLALAWLITFSMLFALGALAFLFTKTMALLNLYFGLYSLLSGYLMPIPLLPSGLRQIAEVSPFRFMFSLPVELMKRPIDASDLAVLMLAQVGWAIVTLVGALWVWRKGLRHFEAVGG